MKILVVGYMHRKNDKRVYRTVKALSKYAKVIYQYMTDTKESEYEEGNIRYLPIEWREDINTNALLKFWKRRKLDKIIMDLIQRTDFDILYMHHFLPSKPLEPFRYAKRMGKKIVFDIHEYHPENFLSNLKALLYELKTSVMKKIFEKQIELADKLIFVSPEQMRYSLGEKRKEALVVPNYANMSVRSDEKREEIVFVGKSARAVEDELLIIEELTKRGFTFKIIGMDSALFKDLKHVHMGFLPYGEMMMELATARFSLISYIPSGSEPLNYAFSLPNKFYDSIAAGTPVIVKDTFVSMARIVQELGIGVVINTEDINGSVRKILKAYESYDKLIQNVDKYKDRFVWDEKKEKEFVDFVLDRKTS
ncbi:glycosyl transferase family 1 [Pseudothermotoga sp. U03pept]|uniref:glycosyl transferase family 1 n=1 Tax=Pseudothermotoga sp. U03pept TaxID=3447012 RepID=UPI003F0ACAB8